MCLFRGPKDRDYSILGIVFGSPISGNYHLSNSWLLVNDLCMFLCFLAQIFALCCTRLVRAAPEGLSP